MPGFGIGMINDDFHIAGIRQVVAERLKRVVMYSIALGPRCFKWKVLSLSGPKATQIRCWMALFNLGSSGEVGSLLRWSSRLFITSIISADTGSSWSLWRPVGKWCDAALSRTVRNIFSSQWKSAGRECLLRAVSTSCLYLSQLAFFRFT